MNRHSEDPSPAAIAQSKYRDGIAKRLDNVTEVLSDIGQRQLALERLLRAALSTRYPTIPDRGDQR